MAIDAVGRRLYIAEDSIDAIVSLDMDGSDTQLLAIDEVVNPQAIAVDPVAGRVYWSNASSTLNGPSEFDLWVMSANLDGSDTRKEIKFGQRFDLPMRMAIVHLPIPEPSGLALAALGGAAYAVKWRCTRRLPPDRSCRRPRRCGRLFQFCGGRRLLPIRVAHRRSPRR